MKMKASLGILIFSLFLALLVGYISAAEIFENNLLERAQYNVVKLAVFNGQGNCTGVVVDEGRLLTAEHCIMPEPFRSACILPVCYLAMIKAGLGARVPLRLIQTIPTMDLAVLGGDFRGYHPISIDYVKGEIFNTEEAILCGYPLGSSHLRCEQSKGLGKSFFSREFEGTVLPGQSGGAVFTHAGRLIGIIHSVGSEGQTNAASTTGVL